MGNRAVIQFGHGEDALGIYLHWDGSPETVDAFLTYAAEKGVRTDDYGVARLTQIIANYIGGDLSIGVGLARNLDRDNYDNGTYVLSDGTWTGRGAAVRPGRQRAIQQGVLRVDPEGRQRGQRRHLRRGVSGMGTRHLIKVIRSGEVQRRLVEEYGVSYPTITLIKQNKIHKPMS